MKDNHKTKVMFKLVTYDINTEDEITEVLAIFPELENLNGLLDCYTPIGQHSQCHKDFMVNGMVSVGRVPAHKVKTATKKEYKELLKELESIGYNLEVIK